MGPEDDVFDIPDVDGAEAGEPIDFDPFDIPDVVETEPAEEAPWYESLASGARDFAAGALDGALLNHAGELGNLGLKTGLPQWLGGLGGPSHEIGGMPPTRAESGAGDDLDMETIFAEARQSLPGKAGNLAGLVGGGAALSSVASPFAAGAAAGGLSTAGDTDYDPVATGLAMAGGGALGALGGALGKGAGAIQKWLKSSPGAGGTATTIPSNMRTILDSAKLDATKGLSQGVIRPGLAQGTTHAADLLTRPGMQSLYRGAGGAAAAVAPQAPLGLSPASAQDIGEAELFPDVGPYSIDIGEAEMLGPVTGFEIGEAELAPRIEIGEAEMLPGIGGESVQAGDAEIRAYAGMPTLTWSLQDVIASGRSGLPPDAENQLAEALLSGDDSRVASANFRLQQKYPGYAKRLQDVLDSLNGG